jgi:uncharacterized membrane protein
MNTVSQEIQDSFYKENGMKIEDAMTHVKKWIAEKNFESAGAGISELQKFLPGVSEIEELSLSLREAQSKELEGMIKEKSSLEDSVLNLPDHITDSEKFLSALGYFGYASLLPILLKRESEFCQLHGRQALVIAVFFSIISYFFIFISHGIKIIGIMQLLIALFGAFQAYAGKIFDIPLLSDFVKKYKLFDE